MYALGTAEKRGRIKKRLYKEKEAHTDSAIRYEKIWKDSISSYLINRSHA